jgi:hypothetical protein
LRLGKTEERDAERTALLHAAWAARKIDPARLRDGATRWLSSDTMPGPVRVEAAHALAGGAERSALHRALSTPDLAVRSAAASALAPAKDALALAKPPLDAVRLGLAAEGAPLDAAVLARPDGRRVHLPALLRARPAYPVSALVPLARQRSDAQLDAIAALGRTGTREAIATLGELARKDTTKDEATRKAAYRALRRAQRIEARKQGEASR